MLEDFTHFDAKGRARMVDVGDKMSQQGKPVLEQVYMKKRPLI